MSGIMNKRQQARHERTLQDLLKVKGNERCADCATRNPGWASWNLGIFLCVRCASLHRKMGTHISKVKSLSMDTWTGENVESMKKNGNTASNLRYNPRGQKPNIPIDADEVDGAMERFIREKYQHKTLSGESRPLPSIKHHTGSSSSSNDVPPPLPPKSNPRLTVGLRSQSATYPTSQAPLPSPPTSDWSSGGSRNGDSKRMAGIAERPHNGRRRSLDIKLDQLRDMGFASESKNATVLKGVSGDVDRAVDALNRLGEGYGNVLPRTRPSGETNGLSFERPAEVNGASLTPQFSPQQTGQSQASASSNPFLRQQQSQAAQYQPALMQPPPPTQPQQYQQQPQQPQSAVSLVESFQNMQVSQSPTTQPQPQAQSQPLFPNNTGSWLTTYPQFENNPFLKTWTPPMTPSPYQYTSTPIPTQPESNPFLRSAQLQALAAANHLGSNAQQLQQPQYQSPQQRGFAPRSASMPLQSPPQTQPYQQAQDFFQVQPQQQPTAQSAGLIGSFTQSDGYAAPQQQQASQHLTNGFDVSNGTAPYNQPSYENQPQQQWQHQQWQQAQPQQQVNNLHSPPLVSPMSFPAQQPTYHDKTSILALYNNIPNQSQQSQPSLQQPPAPPQMQQQQAQAQSQSQPQPQFQQQSQTQSQPQFQQPPQPQPHQPYSAPAHPPAPQRTVTMPISTNPFAAPTGHVSRESVLFTGQGMPGRSTSPDAFSGLSARWR